MLPAAIATFLLAFVTSVGAQPIISNDNSLGQLLGYSVEASRFNAASIDGLSNLIARTGEGQVWDITNVPLDPPVIESVSYAPPDSNMPAVGDARLSGANLVALSDPSIGTWTYHQVDETGQYLLGQVTLKDVNKDGRRDTLVVIFDPISTVFPFPVTMGTAWADSSTKTLEFGGSPPVPEETVVATHVVEGWGTLVTSDGTAPVLRIRTDARITTAGGQRLRKHSIRFVAPVPDGLMSEIDYGWAVEIIVDSLSNPLSMEYQTLSVSTSTQLANSKYLSTGVSLGGNYPNPFGFTTTIPFQIETPGRVRISVYDIIGRLATLLVDSHLPAGQHQVRWEADSVTNGIYRVIIETGASSLSRLMVVQR